MMKKEKEIVNLAFDRIREITLLPEENFRSNRQFDPETWFKDWVGVTRNSAEAPIHILFIADPNQAPYIKTKPIHPSQRIVEERRDGVVCVSMLSRIMSWKEN